MKEELKNLVADFIKAKKQEAGPATLNNYSFYLNRFFNLMNLAAPEELNYQTVRAFRFKLNKLKLNQATQNYHLIALRAFLKYLNLININNLNPKKIFLYPVKRKNNDRTSEKEIEKIIQAPEDNQISEIIKKRDLALLESLYSTRFKVSNIAKLKIKDVSGLTMTQQGKYRLKEYLQERKDKTEFLFLRHDRAGGKSAVKPLTPRSIQRIVAGYAKKAGFRKNITPESFRNID